MKLMTVTEAAKHLGVHPQSLRNWDNSGEFKAMRTIGGQRRYSVEMLEGVFDVKSCKSDRETVQMLQADKTTILIW